MTDWRCTQPDDDLQHGQRRGDTNGEIEVLVTTNNTTNTTPGSIDSMTPRGPPMASMTEKSSPSPAAARDAIPVRFFWF